MGLNVYEIICEVIGPLPFELTWVYGLFTILFLGLLFVLIVYPFYRIFKGW